MSRLVGNSRRHVLSCCSSYNTSNISFTNLMCFKLRGIGERQRFKARVIIIVFMFSSNLISLYRNDPKFSDRYAWASSADPDQGLHCLLFRLHLLDSLLYGKAT